MKNFPKKIKYFFLTCISLFVWLVTSGQNENLKLLYKKAISFTRTKDFDSAFYYSEELLTEALKQNSNAYMIDGYTIRASAFQKTNQLQEAAEDYYRALKLCTGTSERKQKAHLFNALGVLNYEQKNLSTAKNYFREEIEIQKTLNDTFNLATNLINLSSVHRALREFDSSGYLLNDAKIILNKTNSLKLLGYFYSANGIHYHSIYRNDSVNIYFLDSALNNYKWAYQIFNKLNNIEESFRPLFNIGTILHSKKKYKEALENYFNVKKIADSLNLYPEKLKIYGNIGELYSDIGDFKNSTTYFRKYIELKDSLSKNQIEDYALRLDKQFQTEKNKEIIQKQKLQITEQSKRVYLYLFLMAIVIGVLIVIVVYFNFKKRLHQKTEEAKKKFFSNVVHEIRTPLTMIQAPLKVLRTKLNSSDDIYNIEMAEKNIGRLNELINQMLDISKLDATKYTLNETFGDLEIFFHQLVNNYSNIASEKNIDLLPQFQFQNKIMFFDKDALEKITGNLLSNAIKYTSNNSRIGIGVFTEETEEGIKLTINVWDTGAGISEKDQEKIFSRFYRSSNTATNTKGAGIGLSLVKDLVDLYNGKIEVKSKIGKGSTFTVNLMLKAKEDSIEQKISSSIENASLILLVEDDSDILEFNAQYLQKNNFNILKARNGKEALELLENALPDLIITDLMMPEMDGLSFLNAIKSDAATEHIPIIVLSAKASAESRMETMKLGAQGYLSKPFLPDELISLVSNQIEILSKKKTDFKQLIEQPEKKAEEKFVGGEPYTQKLFALIFKHLDDPELTVEKLADLMATNRSHFQRKIKNITGFSPSELIKAVRLEKAKEFLLTKSGNITEVAYQTGFSSPSYFSKSFTQHFGISPTQMLHQKK